MLTLSTPAAPRFRLTAWKACRMSREVILPVSECTLIFFMVGLSRFAITKFGLASFWRCFLALPLLRFSLGFPARARAVHFVVLARGANFPHGLVGRSPSSIGFSFHPPEADYSGSAAAL